MQDKPINRFDTISDDPDIFSGLVWSGPAAKDLGLIDGYGEIYQIARDYTDDSHIHNYTVRNQSVLSMLTASVEVAIDAVLDNLSTSTADIRLR